MKEKCRKYLFGNQKICLIIIIVMQICMILYAANQKQGYHIDEIYSYILSNSYNADRISNADWMWGKWIEGKEFEQFVTVQEGEGFSYQTVYFNNSTDCHPPLFYWVLHTVCSFFPDQFSKWFGIGMNLVCFVVTGIFIYLISNALIASSKYKLLPVFLYGFSKFAVDTCMFIRMYMMLTMFAMIFVYIHILMFKKGISYFKIAAVMCTIYLGAMTQYYFLILSFWGVLLYAIYLLCNRKVKQMFIYGIGACISVGMMILSYPYVIAQAAGSSTNNVGNEVARSLLDFGLWLRMSCSLAKKIGVDISYWWFVSLVILGAAVLLCFFLCRANYKHGSLKKPGKEICWIMGVILLVFFSVSFIGGEYVYLRYVYFIVPLFYIVAITLFENISHGYKKLQAGVIAACVLFSVLNAAVGTAEERSSYLMLDNSAKAAQMNAYSKDNLIVITDRITTAVPTGNMMVFKNFDSVYMDTKNNIVQNNILNDCINDDSECIVFITTDTYWLDGLDAEETLEEITSAYDDLRYSLITEGILGEYYLITT